MTDSTYAKKVRDMRVARAWSQDQLAEIVTRDCMIGVAVPKPGVTSNVKLPVHRAVHPVHSHS